MYESICYKKPFLKEVIVRIDFSAEVPELEERVPQKIANAALKRFQILEPKKRQSQQVEFKPTGVSTTTKDGMEWNYFGKNREKRLVITPQCLFVAYNNYKSFEQLNDDFIDVIKVLFDTYKEFMVSRFGLRYINVLDTKGKNVFDWKDNIASELLGLIDLFGAKDNLSRLFHILEYNYNGMNLKYQFGMPNPDYPSIIKKRHFVLDLDAYFQGPQNFEDVNEHLESAHSIIQKYYEMSITDKTRKIMRQEMGNARK